MSESFTLPQEYKESFRRLMPYLAAPLRHNEEVLYHIYLYLKLGNEKLARVAIEAFNETRRLQDLENQKRLREEALLRENRSVEELGEGPFDEDETDSEEETKGEQEF